MKVFSPQDHYMERRIKVENDQVQLGENVQLQRSGWMHPDQATEAIVDFALRENKPFEVPCCVFPECSRIEGCRTEHM